MTSRAKSESENSNRRIGIVPNWCAVTEKAMEIKVSKSGGLFCPRCGRRGELFYYDWICISIHVDILEISIGMKKMIFHH